MTTGEQEPALDETETNATTEESAEGSTPVPEKVRFGLDVEISDVGPCKKHIKATIGRADIDRQFNDSLKEMSKEAFVPGFRPGHAPRQLVQKRFRKEVANQVKSTLLMAALEQLDEEHKLNPISQPTLDIESVELPDEGPIVFEMDVEVRPEFALPSYKDLTVNRPVKTFTEADVDAQFQRFLERYAQIVPKLEGGAELGDFVTADLRFHRDGQTLNEAKEVQFRLHPELRFQDGSVPEVGEALVGVKPGETREAEAKIGTSSPDVNLRGQSVRVTFVVNDLKHLRLPEVNAEFFRTIGFDSEKEVRTALKEMLVRRFQAQQRQTVRDALMEKMISATPFDLPADLVTRQEHSTLRRVISQLKEDGATASEIRAREAELRANAHEMTLRSLKEFFILAKIAEAESIKVEDSHIEDEINAIAERTDESPRRVRARVEKEGLADAIATDILERRALNCILESVTYIDVDPEEKRAVETLDHSATTETLPEPGPTEGEPAAEGEAEGEGQD